MESLLMICAVVGAIGVGAVWLYDATHQQEGGGWRLVWVTATLPFLLVGLLFRGARYGLEVRRCVPAGDLRPSAGP